MSASVLTDITPAAGAAAARRFPTLRHDAFFAPPSMQGTVLLPGFDGGGEWGGAAVDRTTGVIYVNASDVPWVLALRAAPGNRQTKAPYDFVGYERWRDSTGYPVIEPPWGTLSAIDLNNGAYLWRIPLGEHAALTARGVPVTGTEQYGGPIVTAGGLVFIAATMDEKFRAFDKSKGRPVGGGTPTAAGNATPHPS